MTLAHRRDNEIPYRRRRQPLLESDLVELGLVVTKPRLQPINSFERIALRRQCRQPFLRIENPS